MNLEMEGADLSRGPGRHGTAKINSAQNHVALITVREVDCTETHTQAHGWMERAAASTRARAGTRTPASSGSNLRDGERCRVAKVSCRSRPSAHEYHLLYWWPVISVDTTKSNIDGTVLWTMAHLHRLDTLEVFDSPLGPDVCMWVWITLGSSKEPQNDVATLREGNYSQQKGGLISHEDTAL